MDYRYLVSLGAAILMALLAFWATRMWDFTLKKSAANRLENFAEPERRGLTDRLGDALVDRLGLRLKAWKHELRWAHFGGHYRGQGVGSVLGQSVLFALFGLGYLLLVQSFSPLYLGAIALAAYFPYMQLRSKADSVRDLVKRTLPETAALIAAERNAGGSMDTALDRAVSLPGPLGTILREAVDRARTEGGLLFSHAGAKGMIVQHLSELNFSPLEAFATRMDAIAAKGTEGPRRMNDLARDLATEYQVVVARSAETLDNKLLMPMTVFFFVPFMAAVFIPLMVSVFETF